MAFDRRTGRTPEQNSARPTRSTATDPDTPPATAAFRQRLDRAGRETQPQTAVPRAAAQNPSPGPPPRRADDAQRPVQRPVDPFYAAIAGHTGPLYLMTPDGDQQTENTALKPYSLAITPGGCVVIAPAIAVYPSSFPSVYLCRLQPTGLSTTG